MLKVNNESKIRRATKSIVLGKAKVISYDNLVIARAIRSEKEAVKERGRKKIHRRRKIGCAASLTYYSEINTVVATLNDRPQIDINRVPEVLFQAPIAIIY